MTTFAFKTWIIMLWLAASFPQHDPADPTFYTREVAIIWVKPGYNDPLSGRNGNLVYVMDGQKNIFTFYDWENQYRDGDLVELVQWDYNNYEILSTTYKGSLWTYDNNHHFTGVGYPEWFDGGWGEYVSQ